ncbi:hypothetical protein EVAR_93841_1 [Eumeta japonica]|uniref:Uncharacterized protein n=1 Tax=Eumeta variegata TaxID=151549 RepID=A0A4C1TWY2_EUMVA|nr:hypothetical protein EVAR_93841_1 [Eumeta japonica]
MRRSHSGLIVVLQELGLKLFNLEPSTPTRSVRALIKATPPSVTDCLVPSPSLGGRGWIVPDSAQVKKVISRILSRSGLLLRRTPAPGAGEIYSQGIIEIPVYAMARRTRADAG